MIEIKNLKISAWDKEILKWVSLNFETWKNYILAWKNWSGKSSLANFLMWNPNYSMISWEIKIDWIDLISLDTTQRAIAWVFLSFQSIPEIPWINMWEYLKTIYNNYLKQKSPETKPLSPFVFKRFIKKYLDELGLDEVFLQRDLNVWFSWWEKRKIELLQIKLLNPKYIILDEIDSWLDVDAFKVVSNQISSINSPNNSIIVITHHFKIIDSLNIDKIYVLKDWEVEKTWWIEIINEILENWFK